MTTPLKPCIRAYTVNKEHLVLWTFLNIAGVRYGNVYMGSDLQSDFPVMYFKLIFLIHKVERIFI